LTDLNAVDPVEDKAGSILVVGILGIDRVGNETPNVI
jgi:hypothetical protein